MESSVAASARDLCAALHANLAQIMASFRLQQLDDSFLLVALKLEEEQIIVLPAHLQKTIVHTFL